MAVFSYKKIHLKYKLKFIPFENWFCVFTNKTYIYIYPVKFIYTHNTDKALFIKGIDNSVGIQEIKTYLKYKTMLFNYKLNTTT